MILRPAQPEDAAALGEFGRDAFVAAFGHLYSKQDLQAFLEKTYACEAMQVAISDPAQRFQLAIEDGRIAGFCRLVLTCGWSEHARGRNAIELKQLYTDPARTGSGMGGRLMDWALDFARQYRADEIQLSVWSENFGAQRFYARYGFEKMADIEFWVNEHRDEEFLYALRL